jgi:hypothetical protein
MEILDLKFAGVSLWWWFGIAAICLFSETHTTRPESSWTTWPEENNSRLRKKPAKSRPGKTSRVRQFARELGEKIERQLRKEKGEPIE